MITPPPGVLEAIMSPVTNVTRRIEVYEADAETPWGDADEISATLIDGNVSVDSTREERRSLDMTLDNSSGILDRNPNGGFWYDKIIKVFRGVEYTAFELYADLILGQRPGLFWRMDNPDVLRDLSGRSVNAARVGWPVVTRPLVDSPDSMGSTRFAESDTYFVSSALPATHEAVTDTVWTMEAWVRPIGVAPVSGGQAFGREGIDTRIGMSSISRLHALVENAEGSTFEASALWEVTPGNIYHLAATMDGSFIRLYVNGQLEASNIFEGTSISSTSGFAVGNDITAAKQFRGDVDECVYYSRVLSENEIAQRYQAGRGRRTVVHQWDTQVGEFLIDKIDEPRFPRNTKITARDYTKRCLLAKLPTAMSFDTNTPLENLVRSMAANAGITKFLLPKTGVTIGTATDFDQGTERWNVMSSACESSAFELYFTPDGYLTMRKQRDPATSAPALTFETGAKGNLVDWSKSTTDTEIFNRIICVSESNDESLPFFGEASNVEPTSPTSIAKLGERTFIFTSAFFTSDSQCRETAKSMLKVKGLESFTVDFSSLVLPWAEAGEIVEFLDPEAASYDPTRFLLSSFSIPLKLSPMTASARRIIIVDSFDPNLLNLVPGEGGAA